MYLTLIVSLSPHMTKINVNLYLFGQFKNLYYIFIFLLLLFMENKQTLNKTWKCNECLFNNDCNQNNVYCQLCGYERINIAVNHETQTLHTKIIDNSTINIKKEFDDLTVDIKIFGKDHMNTIQCNVEEIQINNNCNNGLETCQFIQRVTFVSMLYKHLQNKNDFDRYFDALTAEKQYTISDLLNDFAHVLDHCSFDVNYQTILKYAENIAGQCIKTCKLSARHIARRYSRDNNENVYLEKQLLLRTMDRIHCFLFHNFQRERNDSGITQIARPRIECPDTFCEWKHSDTIPYSQLDPDRWKMTNEQRQHIAQYHKQFHIRLQNYESDKQQQTYVQLEPEEKTDIEYGDFGEFGFGSFIYYELLSPKHCSLKKEIEEVKDNNQVNWELMWLKASKLSECDKAKQIRNVDNSLQFISIEHILSIVLYTDCDDLQKRFRQSFYKMDKQHEDNETIIKRHCDNFYHWGKWLNDAIYTFGDKMKSDQRLFHGLDKKMLFKSFSTDFNTPTSTTSSFKTASIKFAQNRGIVLSLKPRWKSSSKWNRTKKMNISWISNYCDELEHLFYGNFNQLLIEEIWDIGPSNYACGEYIKALQLLQMMCDGNIGNVEYNMDIVQHEDALRKLDSSQVEKYKYIYDNIFFLKQTVISLMKLINNELMIDRTFEESKINDDNEELPVMNFKGDIPVYVKHMMRYFCRNREKIAILNGMEYLKQLIQKTYQNEADFYKNEVYVHCPYCEDELLSNMKYNEIMQDVNMKEKLFKNKKCSYCFQKIIVKTRKTEHNDHQVVKDIFYVCCNEQCEYLLCESCLRTIPSEFMKRLFPKAKFYYVLPVLSENKQNALKVELLRSIGFL
eukprot:462033_1